MNTSHVPPEIRTLAALQDPLLEFTRKLLTNKFQLPKEGQVAREWCRIRALDGDADAQLAYAQLLNNGLFGYKNRAEALLWIQRAADQCHPAAMVALAPYVEQGRGDSPKDIPRALALIRAAAEKGYAPAWGLLGIWYQFGLHVEENLQIAMDHHRKAAEGGFVGSMYTLGCMLISTEDVSKWKEGVTLIEAAADRGLYLAHETLGGLYRKGESGLGIDAERSRHHYYVAKKLSSEAGAEFGVAGH